MPPAGIARLGGLLGGGERLGEDPGDQKRAASGVGDRIGHSGGHLHRGVAIGTLRMGFQQHALDVSTHARRVGVDAVQVQDNGAVAKQR